MTIKFKHKKQSSKTTSTDPDVISRDQWNDDHEIDFITEDNISFSLSGHNHDNSTSKKAATAMLADSSIKIKDKITTNLRDASNTPLANEAVILDANGDYCQGDAIPIIKKEQTMTMFGKMGGINKTSLIGTDETSICKNCYTTDNGTTWFYITSNPASRIEFGTNNPIYYQSSSTTLHPTVAGGQIDWNYSDIVISKPTFPSYQYVYTTGGKSNAVTTPGKERYLNTSYTNSYTESIFITLSIYCYIPGNFTVYVGNPSSLISAGNIVAKAGQPYGAGNPNLRIPVSFWVLPGYATQIVNGNGGEVGLEYWTEWTNSASKL